MSTPGARGAGALGCSWAVGLTYQSASRQSGPAAKNHTGALLGLCRLRASQRLPDSPERNRLYRAMARQMEVDTTWVMGATRYKNTLFYPWMLGYKKHPILHAPWPFMDIDNSRRPAK